MNGIGWRVRSAPFSVMQLHAGANRLFNLFSRTTDVLNNGHRIWAQHGSGFTRGIEKSLIDGVGMSRDKVERNIIGGAMFDDFGYPSISGSGRPSNPVFAANTFSQL